MKQVDQPPGEPPATGEPGQRVRGRRQHVQAAETGMVVLKGLARLGGRGALSALAAHIGESPAKVHRYLMSLAQEGLVAQDPQTQQYFLGPEAIQIGLAAMRQADPLRLAAPALVRIRETLEVTCFVAVMGNKGPTIVRMEEPSLPVTINVRIGSVMPLLWSATGRVFLGLSHDASLRRLADNELAQAPQAARDSLDADDPVGHLQDEVRQQQMACIRGTYLPGISAVAVPLYDHAGRVSAVLTALGASGGFDPSPTGPIATTVQQEAHAVSLLLGNTGSDQSLVK